MNKTIRSIEEIKNAYVAGEFTSKNPFSLKKDKLKEGHIFDENKSVKWNKEQVEAHNNLIDNRIKEYREDQSRLSKALHEETIEALQNEYSLNRKQAERVQSYVYAEYHSSMFDYFQYLAEVAELAEDVISLNTVDCNLEAGKF